MNMEEINWNKTTDLKTDPRACCTKEFSPYNQVYRSVVVIPEVQNNHTILRQDMLPSKDTKYIIRYNMALNGLTVTIPENCILEFDGGCITGGTLVGNDTLILNVGDVDCILDNVTKEGTWRTIEYNKDETDAMLAEKADKADTYTKEEVDALIDTQDTSYDDKLQDYYTKRQSDTKYQELEDMIEPKADKDSLSDVAFSGRYDDLLNQPVIPSLSGYAKESWVSDKIEDMLGVDASGISTLKAILEDGSTASGILTHIARKADSIDVYTKTEVDGIKETLELSISYKADQASTYTKPDVDLKLDAKANASSLSRVATSGLYSDLINKPVIPSAPKQANWNQTDPTALDYIKNKPTMPTLARVATSGAYNDLIGKPVFKTINGQTITGIGDIVISGASHDGASSLSWTATVREGAWSRIFSMTAPEQGTSCIVTLGCKRLEMTVVLLVNVSRRTEGQVVLLSCRGGNNIIVPLGVRISASFRLCFIDGISYLELKDSIREGVDENALADWFCSVLMLGEGEISPYYEFEEGGYHLLESDTVHVIYKQKYSAIENIRIDGQRYLATRQDGSTFTIEGLGSSTNVQADWNQTNASAADYIKNKPTIPTVPALATVATSGSYNDLSNKPTIPTVPTKVSAFDNDAGYIMHTDINRNSYFNLLTNRVDLLEATVAELKGFFCKLTLNNDTIISIIGDGTLTADMVSTPYSSTVVSVDVRTLCTSIDDAAFRNCVNLRSVDVEKSVLSIGANAFRECSSLVSIDLRPTRVISIGGFAFMNCTQLMYADFPNTLTSIGEGLLNGCTNLVRCTLSSGLSEIPKYMFENCSSLTSITLPESITKINAFAFRNCASLSSITIPSNVTLIDSMAFWRCKGLASVTCNSLSVPTLGSGAFSQNAEGRKIYVPESSVDAYKAAEGWSEYANDIYPIE